MFNLNPTFIPDIDEIESIDGTLFTLKSGDTFDFYVMFENGKIDSNIANAYHDLRESFRRKQFFEQKRIRQASENPNDELFKIKTVQEWIHGASMRPTPKQLFSYFWYEGEICILFADTNTGKSILAVQIADAISSGIGVNGFAMESMQQNVLYVDFELSDKQFQIRYTNEHGQFYCFNEDFLRAELSSDCTLPEGKSFEQFIIESLERAIFEHGYKVLILDNITYLRNDNEKGKDALSLMKELKSLKSKYGLSILCLAHVPKRDSCKPISKNDLADSKMLINFCDSAFAIGESALDSSMRYLKQIKTRNNAIVFDADNIPIFKIEKSDCFLKFDHTGYSTEREHLRQQSDDDRDKRIVEATKMKAEGKSNVQIATHFGVSEGCVRKWKLP